MRRLLLNGAIILGLLLSPFGGMDGLVASATLGGPGASSPGKLSSPIARAAMAEGEPLAPAPTLPVTTTATIGYREGGKVTSQDGLVSVEFPPDALDEDFVILLVRQRHPNPPPYNLDRDFSLYAHKAASQTPFDTFSRPFTITVKYDDTASLAEASLRLYYFNPRTDRWEMALPSYAISSQKVIVAHLAHFSDYAAAGNSNERPALIVPKVTGEVSLFTGAATASYPIEVPPGVNGLAPNLAFSYNSSSVDHTSNDQASWVGQGNGRRRRSSQGSLRGTA